MSGIARGVVVGLAALGLIACPRPQNPVERDIQSVKDRSVPLGGRITVAYSPRREGQTLHASWEIELEMSWDAHAAGVKKQLNEFRAVSDDQDTLRFSRALAGDAYSLVLKRTAASRALTIEATFLATPF